MVGTFISSVHQKIRTGEGKYPENGGKFFHRPYFSSLMADNA